MGLCLIAASWIPGWLVTAFFILLAAVALGAVIFVHELGHFLVAKLCGVKCEKFYLGFDFFGLKLCKFTWGETEYGIGIFPLGGYVKMLGQEDNPARLREEVERAQAQQLPSPTGRGNGGEGKTAKTPTNRPHPNPLPEGEGTELEAARQALYDPRSYLAQSVPKRMAIISAGVVMNVIFAFVVATVAYSLGVEQPTSGIGGLIPGDTAWQLNLKVGDRITAIDGEPVRRYMDVLQAVSLGDNLDHGLTLTVQRPGEPEPIRATLQPDRAGLKPTIGVFAPYSTTLNPMFPARPGTAAADAEPGFDGGDQVIAIDGKPVENYADIHRALAENPDETLEITVKRKAVSNESTRETVAKNENENEITVRVAPNPMRRLGLVMGMGPVTAVQQDSPADAAGIRPGDVIRQVDGDPIGDPMTLPDRLRRMADKQPQVTLTIEGRDEPLDVALRPAESYNEVAKPDGPVATDALGIAYMVTNRVEAVVPGSPADEQGIRPGMVIAHATLLPVDSKLLTKSFGEEAAEFPQEEYDVTFGEDKQSWPHLFYELQNRSLSGTTVKLTTQDGETFTLGTADSPNWFNPDRGLEFMAETFTQTAENLREAVWLGAGETWENTTLVFRTIQKLLTRQVSPRLLHGPLDIVKYTYYSAAAGLSTLLLFLCMLSANLAVLNFLPIPVLDGGHMVFLAYEAVRRKPPSEAFQVGLSYIGLALILALMVWVFGLDLNVFSRQ